MTEPPDRPLPPDETPARRRLGARQVLFLVIALAAVVYFILLIVQVLVGARFGPREKVFDAVVDKVEVKTLGELSPREIEHDNPEIRRTEDMALFLSQLYNREVTPDDTVTVIRFSQIVNPRGV